MGQIDINEVTPTPFIAYCSEINSSDTLTNNFQNLIL